METVTGWVNAYDLRRLRDGEDGECMIYAKPADDSDGPTNEVRVSVVVEWPVWITGFPTEPRP